MARPAVPRTDRIGAIAVALCAAWLIAAAPPVDGDLPKAAPGFAALDTGPAPAFVQPRHDAPLDPPVAALVVARLVQLHLLDTPADAQDAARAAEAVRAFQTSVGLKPTGLLDRKTLALMAL